MISLIKSNFLHVFCALLIVLQFKFNKTTLSKSKSTLRCGEISEEQINFHMKKIILVFLKPEINEGKQLRRTDTATSPCVTAATTKPI
jgi:hypothetical protein